MQKKKKIKCKSQQISCQEELFQKVERKMYSAQHKAGEISGLTDCDAAAIFPEQGVKSFKEAYLSEQRF